VKVGCDRIGGSILYSQEYIFDLDREVINRITCFDRSKPEQGTKCPVEENEILECAAGSSYIVEMFDLASQKIQGLATPPSLGSFSITKEMT